jgi:hypothetical protein
LIYALLQRRVRRNLAKETKPLVIPGKRKSFSPTGTMLLEMLKPLTVITFETDSGRIHQVAENQLGSQHFFGQFAKPLLKGARFPSASATVWG